MKSFEDVLTSPKFHYILVVFNYFGHGDMKVNKPFNYSFMYLAKQQLNEKVSSYNITTLEIICLAIGDSVLTTY